MMCSAQICASRNSWCSTQLALTSFHVRVELALHAASTVAWCWPRCIKRVANRAKLAMELKRIFAASCMPRRHTSWPRPGCGPRWAANPDLAVLDHDLVELARLLKHSGALVCAAASAAAAAAAAATVAAAVRRR